MRYTGIAQVSALLVEVLRSHMVPEIVRQPDQIGLCEPQETGDFMVGVWLYDIQECMQLNRHEMVTIDSRRQKYPSVYVNLHYMITARSVSDLKYRADEEVRMLGKILQTMKDTAVLELSGLEGADGGEPVCQINLKNLPMEEKQRIYHVPDGCYKTSLFYEVGPVEIASEKERSVRRVTELLYTLDEKERQRL